MSKNQLQIYVHIVFATKNRKPLINNAIEKILFPLLWNTIEEKDCTPLAINGTEDHIHILLKLSSNVSIAQLLKSLKGKSSKTINDSYTLIEHFQWQRGYGAFSIHHKQVSTTINYIKNQKEHHRNNTTDDGLEF